MEVFYGRAPLPGWIFGPLSWRSGCSTDHRTRSATSAVNGAIFHVDARSRADRYAFRSSMRGVNYFRRSADVIVAAHSTLITVQG